MVQLVLPGFEHLVEERRYNDYFNLELEPTFKETLDKLTADLHVLVENITSTITTAGYSFQEFADLITTCAIDIDWGIRDGYVETGQTTASTDITRILRDYGNPRGETPPETES